jgi:hypothetical protein
VATHLVAIMGENGVDEDTVGHITDSLGPLRRKSSPQPQRDRGPARHGRGSCPAANSSRVRKRMRSASNSATISRMRGRPIGSAGGGSRRPATARADRGVRALVEPLPIRLAELSIS